MPTTARLESMEVEVAPTLAVQLAMRSASTPDALGAAMGSAFDTLAAFMRGNGIVAVGPPRAIYTTFDRDETSFVVAYPIAATPLDLRNAGDVTIEMLPGGRALRFVHQGPYDELHETYARIEAWLRERGGISTAEDWARYSPMWEEYLGEPGTTPASELVTRIYLSLK
jgi:effector-binding domain-containing protein